MNEGKEIVCQNGAQKLVRRLLSRWLRRSCNRTPSFSPILRRWTLPSSLVSYPLQGRKPVVNRYSLEFKITRQSAEGTRYQRSSRTNGAWLVRITTRWTLAFLHFDTRKSRMRMVRCLHAASTLIIGGCMAGLSLLRSKTGRKSRHSWRRWFAVSPTFTVTCLCTDIGLALSMDA